MRMHAAVLLAVTLAGLMGCGNGDQRFRYTGVLEGTVINVPALVGGKLIYLKAFQGAAVQAGDTLAVLDTTELALQFDQVEARLQELKIKESMALADVQRRQTDLTYLQEKYERLAVLVKTNSSPRQTLDDLANRVAGARIALQTARQNLESLQAARSQVIAQRQLIRKKLRDAVVRAPMDGWITETYYLAGEAVPPLAPIVELINTDTLEVKIYVAERLLPHLQLNQTVSLFVDGLDQPLQGTIRWISPKAEFTPKSILTPETRSSLVYAVKVVVANPEGKLKHGMPVEVEL